MAVWDVVGDRIDALAVVGNDFYLEHTAFWRAGGEGHTFGSFRLELVVDIPYPTMMVAVGVGSVSCTQVLEGEVHGIE